MTLVLLLLVGCNEAKIEKSSRFLLDTVVSLVAECDNKTLSEAFSLCEEYEKLLSKTKPESDVSKLNESEGFIKVSDATRHLVERSIYYGKLSNGKFDITLCPVINLWDFEGTGLPDRKEIAAALKRVGYSDLSVDGDSIDTKGKEIDLGGIAKGYIADRLLAFFEEKDVKSGIINLGGNVIVFGERNYDVGIKKPFFENEISATLRLKNKSVVTSGIYERYIEDNGKIYHHILDPETGFSAETDLYSATVISDTSLDGDALATICILFGKERASELIESIENTEAVFIDNKNNLTYTSGLKETDGVLILK